MIKSEKNFLAFLHLKINLAIIIWRLFEETKSSKEKENENEEKNLIYISSSKDVKKFIS